MRNGPDKCCRTCRTWSEWWYWFCRRTGLPKIAACISLKPIPEPSFSFRFSIYLHYCYSTTTPRFFEFRASKSGISYRIAALSWAEFSYRKIRVCCFAREMVMVSSLGCEFDERCSLCFGLSFLVFIILSEGPHFWQKWFCLGSVESAVWPMRESSDYLIWFY